MNFVIGRIMGMALVVALLLVLLPGMAAATNPDPLGEAGLFSLTELGPVDLSPKTVTVELYIPAEAELVPARRMAAQVWNQVAVFYARLGVRLVEVTGQPAPGPLAPAKRLRIEILTDQEWLNRTFQAFQVAPPFRLRFLQVCVDKCAFAHLPISTIHVSFKRFQRACLNLAAAEMGANRHWLANLLIHELGHLLGLYHSYEFTNDPVARSVKGERLPNFMSQDIAFQPALGFTDYQKRLVHSYLSGGKIYQQYRQVNFDHLDYLEKIKQYNGYQESAPKKKTDKVGSMIPSGKKLKTFDDDDDEGDDD